MAAARPRVALNAQLLRVNEGYRSAGISRYIQCLLRELPKAAPEFHLDVFSTAAIEPAALPGITIRRTRMPTHKPVGRIVWEQTALPYELLRTRYALLHALAFVSPLFSATPTIVTVYDLSFFLYPDRFNAANRLYLQLGTRWSVQRARRVIAISLNTRQDLIRILHTSPQKIDVVPPGVEEQFFIEPTVESLSQFRANKALPDHFVLYVGTIEPRKNLPNLIRAFADVMLGDALPHHLVMAGARGWNDLAVLRAIEETGIGARCHFIGFVSDQELPLLYRSADVFVYPSQYEGFGMPPLEALASGAAVITSSVSSLPEAVGDAALLVHPNDKEQLADALRRVLLDTPLREDLRRRGPAHAARFTWRRAAELTADSYRRALGMVHDGGASIQRSNVVLERN